MKGGEDVEQIEALRTLRDHAASAVPKWWNDMRKSAKQKRQEENDRVLHFHASNCKHRTPQPTTRSTEPEPALHSPSPILQAELIVASPAVMDRISRRNSTDLPYQMAQKTSCHIVVQVGVRKCQALKLSKIGGSGLVEGRELEKLPL